MAQPKLLRHNTTIVNYSITLKIIKWIEMNHRIVYDAKKNAINNIGAVAAKSSTQVDLLARFRRLTL